MCALALALLPSAGVLAQSADSVPTARARRAPVFTLYFENDTFSGTDQHYTNGVKLSWLTSDLVDWGQSGWRKTIVESLPFVNRAGGQKNFGFAIGQNTVSYTHLTLPTTERV